MSKRKSLNNCYEPSRKKVRIDSRGYGIPIDAYEQHVAILRKNISELQGKIDTFKRKDGMNIYVCESFLSIFSSANVMQQKIKMHIF